MKDERGLYYYPFPENRRTRMYVRMTGGGISFRLWSADDRQLWDQHGWVPYDAIEEARAMYTGKGFDPQQAYDVDTARALIEEDR
jgi:hypothetical protein